jgi:hypothetical protein
MATVKVLITSEWEFAETPTHGETRRRDTTQGYPPGHNLPEGVVVGTGTRRGKYIVYQVRPRTEAEELDLQATGLLASLSDHSGNEERSHVAAEVARLRHEAEALRLEAAGATPAAKQAHEANRPWHLNADVGGGFFITEVRGQDVFVRRTQFVPQPYRLDLLRRVAADPADVKQYGPSAVTPPAARVILSLLERLGLPRAV